MTRTPPIAALFAAPLAALGLFALSACATSDAAARAEAFELVEENASISNRHLLRRLAVIEDDTLLAEIGAGELYRIKLFPGCIDFADVFADVRLAETGSGIDRTSRFIVDGQSCPVRTIDQVRRVRPSEAAAETASLEAEPDPEPAAE
jgi:hypothetical protein